MTAVAARAYDPRVAGSRICVGKRFGQTEVKLVAARMRIRGRV